MVSLTDKQQRDLLIGMGLADFLVDGKITAYTKKALTGALRRIVPAAGRAAPRVAGTAWLIARRHPVIAVGSLIAAGIVYPEERDQLIRDIQGGAEYAKNLVDQGGDFIEREFMRDYPQGQVGSGVRGIAEFDYSRGRSFGVLPISPTQTKRKKRPSKFNKAVSAGMKAIKKSRSYGGKGKIKPAKKAFTLVTKMAAAKKKKKKAPKSGIRRTIWNAMRGY